MKQKISGRLGKIAHNVWGIRDFIETEERNRNSRNSRAVRMSAFATSMLMS